MATLFDLSALNQFSAIFTFLLVWVVVYAVMQLTNVLKGNKGMDSIVAFVVAIFFALSPNLSQVLKLMTPWFVIAIIFFMFLWMLGRFIGLTDDNILDTMGKRSGAFWWIFSIGIIIIVYALSTVFGQGLLEATEGDNATGNQFQENVTKTLFNPKVIGMAILLIIASLTIRFMTSVPAK